MKLIAVQGFSYALSDQSDPTITATITLTGVPSLVNKVNGNSFCLDGFTVQVTNIATATASVPDPGPYTASFSATALKTTDLSENKKPLRQGDKTGTINATPHTPPSASTPEPVTFTITITNANQTKSESN